MIKKKKTTTFIEIFFLKYCSQTRARTQYEYVQYTPKPSWYYNISPTKIFGTFKFNIADDALTSSFRETNYGRNLTALPAPKHTRVYGTRTCV